MLAASGGFTFGALTAFSTNLRSSAWRLLTGFAIVAVSVLMHGPWVSAFCLLALVALASWEFARAGTRCLVGALFGCLTVEVCLANGAHQTVLWSYGLGTVSGALAISLVGLKDILPKARATLTHGVFMFLFLAVGLGSSIALALALNEPRSYWIAFIFVLRGLVPLERQREAVLRYAMYATIGVLLSLLMQVLGLPEPAQIAAAFALALLGIKYVAHEKPISAFCFTGAITLSSATTMVDAVYRLEAVVIVVFVILLLVALLDRLWRFLKSVH